eukprot:906847-Amorphochlora_amoeboformis.AAC.1
MDITHAYYKIHTGHVLAKNPGYCKKEKISIAYLASKLYCLRFQSLWPFVDVFDGETLEALGSVGARYVV